MSHTPRNIQTPYTAADFWAQWGSDTPRMCACVLITPHSIWTGVDPIGLTSNSRDMTLPGHPGVKFQAAPGITPTLVEQALDEPTNLEMQGVYVAGLFEHTDVYAGKWNFARVEVFSVCWDNANLGEFLHFDGRLGEFKDYQTFFNAEARGKMARLAENVNVVTQKLCRVKEFRDTECGHTAATVTIATVEYRVECQGVLQRQAATPSRTAVYADVQYWDNMAYNRPLADFYRNGKIVYEGGVNEGISREIASSTSGVAPAIEIKLSLKRPLPFTPGIGDYFTIIAGCNRTIEDCMKFSNIVNRRAEDWIPGLEAANRIPPSG